MRIVGFESIFYLSRFSLDKQRSRHSVCTFGGSIPPEAEKELLARSGQDVQIFWSGEGQERLIFVGIIENVTVERSLHSLTVTVTAQSYSIREEEAVHARLWQNPSKTLGEVLSTTRLPLMDCRLKLADKLRVLKYPAPILQNKETDFAFLQRMASYVAMPLWVDDTEPGKATINLRETINDKENTILADDILRCTIMCRQGNVFTLALTLKKYLPLGSLVTVQGEEGKYVIETMRVEIIHETYEFHYELAPHKTWQPPKEIGGHLEKTICFPGKVTAVKDPKNLGRIQVSFATEHLEDKDSERLWIKWRSPYTGQKGGIVFLPDEGDMVEVFFGNEEIFAVSSLRYNALPEECQKTAEKYIGNNTGQRIFWQEQALKLASVGNTVFMDTDKIELTVGGSKITLTTDSINLKQGNNELIINSQGMYSKVQGNETTWTDQGIIARSKAEMGFQASGKFNLAAGSSINIKAKGGALSLDGSVVNIG